MSNIGRKIKSPYCNGYFDNDYDLSGAEIIGDGDEYIVIRKKNGIVAFCNFQTWDWKRDKEGRLSGGVYNVSCIDSKNRQKLIDDWCEDYGNEI